MKYFTLAALFAAASLGVSGCSDNQTRSGPPNPPSVHVQASSHDIVSGETVTLTARTQDTYGRDAKIRWTSTAGSLKTEQDGRIARVKFDEPGTYTVRASLLVDGREVQSEMVEIHVKPVG